MRINTQARAGFGITQFHTPTVQSTAERPGRKKQRTERPAGRGYSVNQVPGEIKRTMGRGLMEVHLVDAKGLGGTDFLGKIDPYVIVQYRTHERKSSTARDAGRNPSWNEVVKFQVSSTAANVQHKLVFRIMDHDNFSRDDFLGEASINVTDLISIGMEKGKSELHPAKYRVVTADNSYHGEIKVGITFTAAKVQEDGGQVGGWMHSFRE
ncbi:unnamed protein product [Alopecurus aequalis]